MTKLAALLTGLALAAISGASAGTFVVDKNRSTIKVDAKATGHNFSGTLKDYQISAAGDSATLKPSALALSWSFKDLDTDDKGRDKEMIKWLGGGEPKGSYKFTKIWSKDGKDYAEGALTFHGVTKTVQVPLTTKKDGTTVTISGDTTFNYKDFDLPLIRAMMVMTVDPELKVSFKLLGQFK